MIDYNKMLSWQSLLFFVILCIGGTLGKEIGNSIFYSIYYGDYTFDPIVFFGIIILLCVLFIFFVLWCCFKHRKHKKQTDDLE